MLTSDVRSSNDVDVKIQLGELPFPRSIGLDFVSGGLRDYLASTNNGFWATAKCEISHTSLNNILREAFNTKLGSYPIVMPETVASHLIVAMWEGNSKVSEADLISEVEDRVRQATLISETDKLQTVPLAPDHGNANYVEMITKKLNYAKKRLSMVGTANERVPLINEIKNLQKILNSSIDISKLSEYDMLIEADSGWLDRKTINPDNISILKDLIARGYLRKVGLFKKHYELTEKGKQVIIKESGQSPQLDR
ncbi:MAG: hypothetical protein JRN32_01430 [Nitrososphaerota archaeon]|jgi:hypothetical protein|nr:hypothetical protein [Nitrososphaerota archaeon]MDG7036136.1 hypothetical protein [Nitrososphaerota archaeon]MDG7037798.1 hypothetical protein [Nitrososphaerota archaeon]MDG7045462.1 hypothetical protein [Nitrososphaerota archaeon]